MWFINSGIILAGVAILVASFLLVSRIIKELKSGLIKRRWIILRIFIIVFIVGYLGFMVQTSQNVGIESLIVSGVFLLGSVFVFMVSWLMLQTTRDIKRVASLELDSITDPLLNIYNRRYLEKRLHEEVARINRYKSPLSLIFLDIDHFKEINDRYGHPIGDIVLISLGEMLLSQIRKTDLVARYGGEEMVILLPNTDEGEAYKLAERIRLYIEHATFANTEIQGGVSCTVSLGISSAQDDNCHGADLLNQADAAMYHAKQKGRNRVEIYKQKHEKSE
jgi:diguanylate cyclase (GGDEF)-like protein